MSLKISLCTDISRSAELVNHCNIIYDETRQDVMGDKFNGSGTRWLYSDLYEDRYFMETAIQKREIFLAEIDNQLAGCIRIITVQDSKFKILMFQTLAIDAKFRGKGIARKLVEFAEDLGKDQNYNFIDCDVMTPEDRPIFLCDWYLKLGYKIHGICKVEENYRYSRVRHMLNPNLISIHFRKTLI